ncbi:exo-alpha-sialidase [Streptomyces sp. 7-21]|jgi:Neuraminidase (sialidase)|uniref:sialidase family protein n=1 Tax=Streptomyces sp. 7-21 TaxID=2802283 RepID=UPI00191E3659|nr:sialidase family protein [Streptomyces sp. 7-21]MBL1065133.1 exo-alpha-sialidase [Streptomyces sp. 7-21]
MSRGHNRLTPVALAVACAALLLPLTPAFAAPGGARPAGPASLQTAYATVFTKGEGGYHTFRVPAVVQAPDGSLLAFAEGRVNGPGDDGDIDLVMKRSRDGGRTWGPLTVVLDDGPNKVGNPVPVVDRTTGRLLLNTTHTSGDVTTEDVRCGYADETQTRRSFILHSDDSGATWSAPREITAQVKPGNWRHFVGGPGHAIQLTQGELAGRIVIPGNHSIAPPEGSGIDCLDNSLFGAHALYSDDGGQTWHLGGVDTPLTGFINPNESQAAELADGTVYFNARDQHGVSPGTRAATTSPDGGETFDHPYQEVTGLTAPVVQGSVVALPEEVDPRRPLVFSAPGSATSRTDMTLSVSTDDGATWTTGPVVHQGPAGYSDLVALDEGPGSGTVGVLYENGSDDEPYHQRITFARVPAQLLGGA